MHAGRKRRQVRAATAARPGAAHARGRRESSRAAAGRLPLPPAARQGEARQSAESSRAAARQSGPPWRLQQPHLLLMSAPFSSFRSSDHFSGSTKAAAASVAMAGRKAARRERAAIGLDHPAAQVFRAAGEGSGGVPTAAAVSGEPHGDAERTSTAAARTFAAGGAPRAALRRLPLHRYAPPAAALIAQRLTCWHVPSFGRSPVLQCPSGCAYCKYQEKAPLHCNGH